MKTWLRNLLAPPAELRRLRQENAELGKRLRLKTRELLRTKVECDALRKLAADRDAEWAKHYRK